ncbi:hypothetical protein PR048_013312 [Dryococelus australis]|uniref:HAT C-terminal dimerisation domain-containing protein n=1 Tax=Dryococelus australis TaxID=614101 RepID=A0ABQ9HRW2_9NEOP|nr:hypothetical protein PR048_013312 [Dryococelus australis]
MQGQAYDWASDRSGLSNGVAARFKEDEPRALYTHCHVHLLDLAVRHFCEKVKPLQNVLYVMNSPREGNEETFKHIWNETEEIREKFSARAYVIARISMMRKWKVLRKIDSGDYNLTMNAYDVFQLLEIALSWLITTASEEISFYTLRCLKTYLRCMMREDRLSGLALTSIEQEPTSKLMQPD